MAGLVLEVPGEDMALMPLGVRIWLKQISWPRYSSCMSLNSRTNGQPPKWLPKESNGFLACFSIETEPGAFTQLHPQPLPF